MPKKSVKADVNSFVRGLITEASPLNFPDNASLDEQNFELNRDGTRNRRLGIALEPAYVDVASNTPVENIVANDPVAFQWKGAGGDEERVLLVTQFDNRLSFFDMQREPISGSGFLTEIVLNGFPTGVKYSFATVDGTLVVVAGIDVVCLLTYEEGVFRASYRRIQVRDVWGVEESIASYETDISYRGAIDSYHYYNLLNQSWGIPRKSQHGVEVDPAWLYNEELGVWPSNSETVWPGLQYQPVSLSQQPFERLYTNIYNEVLGADVKAPKGYFIIDLLRRGQSRASAVVRNFRKYPKLIYNAVTVPSDYTLGGAKIVVDFAGRVFYGGFSGEVVGGDDRSPNLSNYVFFSQLIKNKRDFTRCFQEGDPTSRENNEVIDTDGGGIRISGMDRLIGMINLSTHLIVIANNGVWAITGGSDYGFTPTNLKVDKLSSFGGVSRQSIVEHQGRVFFWGEGGIFLVAKNQFGEFVVNNVTETTIQTLYDGISNIAKRNCVGQYDDYQKKIRWVYHEGTRFTADSETYELVFDVVLNSFYKHKIYNTADNSAEIVAPIPWIGFNTVDVQTEVTVNSTPVEVNGDAVIINEEASTNATLNVRYLTVFSNAGFSFSYYRNTEFRDWPHTGGGVDAFAYMETGDVTGGDSGVVKQVPYVIMHFVRTESEVDPVTQEPDFPSGCLMRFKWEFSDTSESKKWSRLVQVYRYRLPRWIESVEDSYDNGFQLVTTKNKIRGRGRAFRMYVETEPYKDCQLVGWNLAINGNSIT